MPGIIGDVLALGKSHSNLDFYYGPYTTLEEAYLKVPDRVRGLGLTVGIYLFKEDSEGEYIFNNNIEDIITGLLYPGYVKSNESEELKYSISSIKEYQWKKGLKNKDLKEKVEEYVLEIDNVSYVTDTINNTITFSIKVIGRGFGVLTNIYLGSNKITSESTVLNEYQNITIKAPENPGNYVYTISTVDSILGNGASVTHEVIWKEVDVRINTSSSIYNYSVKSLLNLQNSNFSFLIFKVNSINIDRVSIIYGENSKILFDINNDNNYQDIYIVNMSDLIGLQSGNLILIKVEGNLTTNFFIKDVVLLTSPGVYSQCEGTIPSIVYNGLSFSASFRFESENIANYLVIIKDNNLDVIYNSSLLSYNINTITLTLNDSTLSDINTSSQHVLYVYIGGSETYNYKFNAVTLLHVTNTEQLEDIDLLTKFLNNLNFNLSEGERITLQSYMLDLSCYIPYKLDSSILFLFGQITITKDIIQFRGIVYPTPIQQNISLGFMCNIKSSYLNNDYYYDALFIDGILCYKRPSTGSPNWEINPEIQSSFIDKISNKIRLYYNTENAINQSPESFILERNFKSRNPGSESSNLPVFNITTINNILTKSDLTQNLIEQIIDNKVTINGVEYDVIDNTSYRVGTFGNLGDAKYNIDNMLNSLCSQYGITQSQTESETISNLSKKIKKDVSKIPNEYLTLTRQIVKSKKLLLKYVAVPCLWSYGEFSGYLLAFTQGTSTLLYALPNFTFKFFTDKTFSTKNNVSLIPIINRNLNNILNYSNEIDNETQYYLENELVAKADYMESSHLNNTPTAMFYNAITTLQNGYTVIDTNGNETLILQNPVENKLNAIEGIPIVLVINGINYGSFMLNIGKSGKSIGFGSNGISLEGTSNDDNAGMSSRFDFYELDTSAKSYLEGIENVDNENEVNSDFVDFLKEGLEYRYSAADADEIGDSEEEYFRILKMWHWVYNHETYTKLEFEEMFNFDFAALYYIQMMIFGLTDNLGKNCMFDLFEEDGQWYVRPYDMDSQAGLENNGNDYLSPVIEISQLFVLDLATKDVNSIYYLNNYTPRFPYSSKTSNLWIRFYNNLKSDIEIFYKHLRTLGYSSKSIIHLCEKEIINKLGIALYNKDFLNKYLSNSDVDQQFAFGNRWFRFKDWIQKRFDFCDTYFKYNHYDAGTTADGELHTVKFSIPLYFIYSYNNLGHTETITSWGMQTQVMFQSTTKQDMWFSPKYIVDDGGLFQQLGTNSLKAFSYVDPRVKLNNLISYTGPWNDLINIVDLSENTYLQDMIISDINTITNEAVIPNSIFNLSIKNSSLIPNLIDFDNLKVINLINCEGNIYLKNCLNLETINISSGRNINLTLINCGNNNKYVDLNISSTTFDQVVFTGSYIKYLDLSKKTFNLSFSGDESYFNIVNLYLSTIKNKELDISNLTTNTLILNSISLTKIITTKPKIYEFLGLLNSNITLFGDTDNTFDGSYISNINSLYMINEDLSPSTFDAIISKLKNGTYATASGSKARRFTLSQCLRILYVKNLNITTGDSLFYNCTELISVTNSNINASGNSMFFRCCNLLTLPTDNKGNSTIKLTSTSGTYMFRSCLKLSYSSIEKVLNNNKVTKYWNLNTKKYLNEEIQGVSGTEACMLTTYSGFLENKTYSENTTINLDLYAFGVNMSTCFRIANIGGADPNTNRNSNSVTITYTGKLPKCVENISGMFESVSSHRCIVSSNIFEGCNSLTDLSYAFGYLSTDNVFFEVPYLPSNSNMNFNGIFNNSRIDVSNILTVENEGEENEETVFKFPSGVKYCSSAFYKTTLSLQIDISRLFEDCVNLVYATNCFRSFYSLKCDHEPKINAQNVNIAGIFASNSSKVVPFGFSGQGSWFSDTESNYIIPHTTTNANNKVGPYYSTILKLTESVNIVNTSRNMDNILEGAIIDNSDGPLNINLNINTKSCKKVCKNITVLENDIDKQVKLVLQLSNIEYGNEAFYGVKIINDVDNKVNIPNTLITATRMFENSNLTLIPSGLSDCSNLTDISYMFSGCSKISGTIPTDTGYFLPISVTNIDYLFKGCRGLYGGIPENFIQVVYSNGQITRRTSITTLKETFAQTAILLRKTLFDDSVDYALNISEMFPKVSNVEGLFYYQGSGDNSLGYILKLNSLCFSNCVNCNDLFNSATVTIPLNCSFDSAQTMRFAFATGRSNSRGITNIEIGNKIIDITGLFSAAKDFLNPNTEVTNNKGTLLNLLAPTYLGMLYGYGDDSEIEYRYVAPVRTIYRSLSQS